MEQQIVVLRLYGYYFTYTDSVHTIHTGKGKEILILCFLNRTVKSFVELFL